MKGKNNNEETKLGNSTHGSGHSIATDDLNTCRLRRWYSTACTCTYTCTYACTHTFISNSNTFSYTNTN
jgi:hypothetical protein